MQYPTGMVSPPSYAVRCLKQAGARSAWLVEPPGQSQRTVKSWPLTPLMALKMLLWQAQPQRQLRGARTLARLLINTPQPIGRWRVRRDGWRLLVQIELRFVPGRSALEMLHDGEVNEQLGRRCGQQIGRIVRTLAGAGVLHRDLKLNNIVIAQPQAQPEVWVLDTVGVRPMMDRCRALLRMFDRLLVQATDQPVTKRRWAWAPLLREALADLSRPQRRAVLRQLRERHQP